MRVRCLLAMLAGLALAAGAPRAAVSTSDDSGQKLTLPQPAQRIVALALFAVLLLLLRR